MSSSDRNAGRNASHHVPLQEVFDDWRRRENIDPQTAEQPNERIEVRINLNQSIVPVELVNELENSNMILTQPNRSRSIVIIFGIPPVNGFGEQQVLEIVMEHARNAILA